MDRKVELLNHYCDHLYGKLKKYFPMLQDDVDLYAVKELLVDGNEVYKSKKAIEKYFDTILMGYINQKHDLVKFNKEYLSNRYEKFMDDYELAHKFLMENKFVCQISDIELPELADNISIEDCRELTYDFFNELYHDDSATMDKVEKGLYAVTNLHYSYIRSEAHPDSIDLNYTNDLKFLLNMVHELSHYISMHEGWHYEPFDPKSVEIVSSFSEKLFLDYLYNSKLKIFKGEKGPRCLKKKDIDAYYMNFYTIMMQLSSRIFDEYNFVFSLNDVGYFDFESLEKYKYLSGDTDLFMPYLKIDEILNNYIPEDCHCLDAEALKQKCIETDNFSYNPLISVEGDLRYLCSYFLSFFFDKIKRNPQVIENYSEYMKDGIIFTFPQTLKIFGLEESDLECIVTAFNERHRKKLKEKGYDLKSSPYFTKKQREEELKKFKELRDKSMEQSCLGTASIIMAKMAYILDLCTFPVSIDVNDISLQLDENEKDEFLALKEKLLKL